MNKLLTEDLLKQIRLMGYDRSKIQNEQNYFSLPKIILEQNWGTTNGDNQYWVDLYNKLKNAGLNVKYGANGKETNDPNAAKFMFFDYWTIWKDLNANDGYPIQVGNTGFQFKFKNTKYKGESINNTLIIPKQNKKKTLKLSDVVRINDTNKIKNIISGFCDALRQRSTLGLDMVKIAEDKKKYSECFQQEWKDISKKDPLYKQKTEKYKEKKPTTNYGQGIEKWSNMNDQSEGALLSRYKTIGVNNLYDLIYIPELKEKNYEKLLNDLKFSKNIVRLGLEKFVLDEKDKKTPYGYTIYKKALQNRKKLGPKFGWVGDESVLLDEGTMNSEFLSTIPVTTPIDPSYLEGVLWVNAKKRLIQLLYEAKKIEKDLELKFENSERFKLGLSPRKPNEKPWSQETPKKYSGPTIGSKNAGVYDEKYDYKQRLQDYISVELKNKIMGYDFFKNKGEEELSGYDQLIRFLYDHNKNIAEQKSEWLGACDDNIYIPKQGVTKKPVSPGCSNELYGKITLKDICKNEKLGGVFIYHSDMKERTSLSGFDFTTLKFEYVKEKRPDQLTCMCANTNILEYKKLPVKGKLVMKCYPVTSDNTNPYYIDVSEGIIELEPRKHLYTMSDNRRILEKIGDWGERCFSGKNEGGESDYHCLLDVASVAAVFIPEVGPIVSMLIDLANGGYYLVDALKADDNMDKNSAYFSAALTILGGLSSGFGDMRALLSAKPNGKSIVAFGDSFLLGSKGLKTESEAVELMNSLQKTYKLSSNELKLLDSYIASFKQIEKSTSKKILLKYNKTIKDIQTKIGYKRWGELMANKKFQDIVVKNNGNIIKSLKSFGKTTSGKDFLIQIGFFVGGEAILPGLITPYIMDKIKSGEWGDLKKQIESNNYDFDNVLEEFCAINEKDINLLQKAWNDKNAIKVNGKYVPWRPGYYVPTKYQTNEYKKQKKFSNEKQKQKVEDDEDLKKVDKTIDQDIDVNVDSVINTLNSI
jgi:hypothetical protein